ncbi:MAG: hypothetical protein GX666_02650 [Tissierellia bacterium]|nr:hypothetical protein [Tissierellia bacterium]
MLLQLSPIAYAKDNHDLDFKERHTLEQIEKSLNSLAKTYPEITDLFSIGSSWQENEIWCLKITTKNKDDDKKTGIAVIANIHGGEQESAESALYTAIELCKEYKNTKEGKKRLDDYIIYVIPVMNPDGYIQSFVYNNRPNLRPTDHNGDGIVFSDPYTDINGDGVISVVYKGKADTLEDAREKIGMESPDWDKNGKLGDDPRTSGIDLNRTFNYQYSRYDIETDPKYNPDSKFVLGNNSWSTNGAGKAAGSEPEVKAVQKFFAKYPVDAMTTIHTGIQCVLYPWCFRQYDPNNPLDAQIPHMKDVSKEMADIMTKETGRNFYTMQSHSDYPTSAEMIDYSYGRHKINSYTVEVYAPGKSDPNAKEVFDRSKWNDDVPEEKWVFYSHDEVKSVLKLDPEALELKKDEGLWFRNTSRAQMAGKAPVDQDIMVKGCYEAIKYMINSEKPGGNDNYFLPRYLKTK